MRVGHMGMLSCVEVAAACISVLHGATNHINFTISRLILPEVCCRFFWPSNEEGRGECRVRAAPAVSCAKMCKEKGAHSIQVQRRHPTFPAQWLYDLYRALPGDRLCCHRRLTVFVSANLTPASGRQDHTISPYASVRPSSAHIRVHRIPPRVRDDGATPLVSGTGWC